MSAPTTIWLASRSPRRALLLQEAGIEARVQPADIDDGHLRHGEVSPEWWVMSLAYLKARRVADMIANQASREGGGRSLVLGADTVCAVNGEVLGQPRDADDARRMLRLMRRREHRTITGVAILPLNGRDMRWIAMDRATVHIGDVTDVQIETYVDSDDWRGKAGAYNLSERLAAGWPITCMGDPATVMGLPMRRLPGWLERAGIARRLA